MLPHLIQSPWQPCGTSLERIIFSTWQPRKQAQSERALCPQGNGRTETHVLTSGWLLLGPRRWQIPCLPRPCSLVHRRPSSRCDSQGGSGRGALWGSPYDPNMAPPSGSRHLPEAPPPDSGVGISHLDFEGGHKHLVRNAWSLPSLFPHCRGFSLCLSVSLRRER